MVKFSADGALIYSQSYCFTQDLWYNFMLSIAIFWNTSKWNIFFSFNTYNQFNIIQQYAYKQ